MPFNNASHLHFSNVSFSNVEGLQYSNSHYTCMGTTTPSTATTDRSSTFSGDFDISGGEHLHPGSNRHWTSQEKETRTSSTMFAPNMTRPEINPNDSAGTGTHNFAYSTSFPRPSSRGSATTMPWDTLFQNASNVRIGEARFNYVCGSQGNTQTSNPSSRYSTQTATTIRNSYNVYKTTNIGSNNVVINGGSHAGREPDVFESRSNDRAGRGSWRWNAKHDNMDIHSPSPRRTWTTSSNTMIQNSYNVNQTTNIQTDNVIYHPSELNPDVSRRRSGPQERGGRHWTFADAYPEGVWEGGSSQHHLRSYNERETHYAGYHQQGSSVGVVRTSNTPPPPYPGGPDLVQSQWETNPFRRNYQPTSAANTSTKIGKTTNASSTEFAQSFATTEVTEQELDSDADSDTITESDGSQGQEFLYMNPGARDFRQSR